MIKTINILLATYNGEKYIRTMIDSLLAQDCDKWQLILSDDGSTDGTVAILQEYAAAYPNKIRHYCSHQHFGNAQGHFMHLLSQFHEADYIMFCDQDDFWHKDKVSKTLALMQQTETDPAVPILVHTDLRVVDGNLQEIAPSFLRYSGLDGHALSLRQLMLQNVVTGCTVMINRALAELACKETAEGGTMLMHDWWLALIAAGCGKIAFLDEATIDYRQHGHNTVGAKNAHSVSYMVDKLKNRDIKQAFYDTAAQAAAVAASCKDTMSSEARELMRVYAALPEKNKAVRLRTYGRYHFWKQGIWRRIAQVIWW